MRKNATRRAAKRSGRRSPLHRKPRVQRNRRASPRKTREPRACCCYIVECSDGTFYTGWAVDAEKRLKVHNAGRGARYTRTRRPVKLVYVELQPDQTTAMRRERAIKRLPRAKKQQLIERMLGAASE